MPPSIAIAAPVPGGPELGPESMRARCVEQQQQPKLGGKLVVVKCGCLAPTFCRLTVCV